MRNKNKKVGFLCISSVVVIAGVLCLLKQATMMTVGQNQKYLTAVNEDTGIETTVDPELTVTAELVDEKSTYPSILPSGDGKIDTITELQEQYDCYNSSINTFISNHPEKEPRDLYVTREVAKMFLENLSSSDESDEITQRQIGEVSEILNEAYSKFYSGLDLGSEVEDFQEKSVIGLKQGNGYFVNEEDEPVFIRSVIGLSLAVDEGDYNTYNEKREARFKKMREIGINTYGLTGLTLENVLNTDGTAKSSINNATALQTISLANQNNMTVSILLPFHKMPSWFLEKEGFGLDAPYDPKQTDLKFSNFDIKYNTDNTEIQDYLNTYIQSELQSLRGTTEEQNEAFDQSVLEVNLGNESRLQYMNEETFEDFSSELEEDYKYDVKSLNSSWGLNIADIWDVSDYFTNYVTQVRTLAKTNSLIVQDFRKYNIAREHRYFNFLTNSVNSLTNKFITYAKFDSEQGILNQHMGVRNSRHDYEDLMEAMSAFGADMHVRVTNENTSQYNMNWVNSMFLLDYVKSMDSSRLYIDPEFHVSDGVQLTEGSLDKGFVSQGLRMSVYHGMSEAKAWTCTETTDGTNCFLYQPRALNEYLTESLKIDKDMERATQYSVTNREVYILYASDCIDRMDTQSKGYMDTVESIYQSLYFHDKSVGIMTEDMLMDIYKDGLESSPAKEIKVLIIPSAKYISSNTIAAIKYLNEKLGKKIICFGQCLQYNERGEAYASGDYFQLENENVTCMCTEDDPIDSLYAINGEYLSGLEDNRITIEEAEEALQCDELKEGYHLYNEAGTAHPDYIEARFASLDGKEIGYAINLGNSEQTFHIKYVSDGTSVSCKILSEEDETIDSENGDYIVTLQPRECIEFNVYPDSVVATEIPEVTEDTETE